jgi:hypothetical protein
MGQLVNYAPEMLLNDENGTVEKGKRESGKSGKVEVELPSIMYL